MSGKKDTKPVPGSWEYIPEGYNPKTGRFDTPINPSALKSKDEDLNWDAITKGTSLAGRVQEEKVKVNVWAGSFGRGDDGSRFWNGNVDSEGNLTPLPIAFFGGDTGAVIGTKRYGGVEGAVPGSPQTFSEAMNEILQSYVSREGGMLELKEALYTKNYLSGEYARKSLALGDQEDPYLLNALSRAMLDGTNYNIGKAERGEKSFVSFKDWLNIAPKVSGDGDSYGGGGGAGGTRIIQQTFDPADYDIAIDQLFQKTIGRGASKEELDFFVQNLQNYADVNPQTTVTKVSGNTTTATTTGGVSAERAASIMREQALLAPGAEEYNKATKYLSYFTEAINSPVKLG